MRAGAAEIQRVLVAETGRELCIEWCVVRLAMHLRSALDIERGTFDDRLCTETVRRLVQDSFDTREVTLSAVPDSGWIFKGWSGDVVTSTNPLTVSMSEDRSMVAVFEQRKLVLSRTGSGTVTLTPPGITPNSYPHTEYYGSDTNVTLSATPGTGWAFKQWSILGNVVTQNPTAVSVNQHVSATVTFEEVSLEIPSIDATNPASAKLHVAITGAFDSVECVVPGGTQVFTNVSDDLEVEFSQNNLSTGTFTFEVTGYTGSVEVSSDTCTATKSSFAWTAAAEESVWPYFLIEGVGATRLYEHGLSEQYATIVYDVQFSGKTTIVWHSQSYLNVNPDF